MPKTRAPKGSRFQTNPAGADKAAAGKSHAGHTHPGKPAQKTVARKAAKATPRPTKGLPDRETLLAYVRESGETDKATIAKAFALKGEERRALRQMLQALETEGALGRRAGVLAEVGALPEWASPTWWTVCRRPDGPAHQGRGHARRLWRPSATRRRRPAPGMGDRLLVRFVVLEAETEARLIRAWARAPTRSWTSSASPTARSASSRDRKTKTTLLLTDPKAHELRRRPGAGADPGHRPALWLSGKLLRWWAARPAPRRPLIAIHAHGIPTGSRRREAKAEAAQPPTLTGREDRGRC